MKTLSQVMLFLSIGCGAVLTSHAQEFTASPDDVTRCTNWINETVPPTVRVVGADFCRGIKQKGSPDAWYSIEKCGERTGTDKPNSTTFCSSSGAVGPDTAVAAGYSGTGKDGGDLLTTTEGTRPAATLYSRTPLHIGNIRIPAGLAQLTFSHDDQGGWQMTIKPEGEKLARTVQLMSDTQRLSATGSELAIGLHYASSRCSDLLNMRELVLTYAGTDLYVCMRPDPIPPTSGDANASR